MELTHSILWIGAAPLADRSDGQPAMSLLDLKRPKVDGREGLRQIKAIRRSR